MELSHKKKLPILADVHMHTSHSHGTASVEEMFNAAVEKGLQVIGFSEHSPRPAGYVYPDDYQDTLKASFPEYIEAVLQLKKNAPAKGIQVLLGLEVDFIPQEESFSQQLCEEYPYDYIIGGLHFQKKWGFDGSADSWNVYDKNQRFGVYEEYYQDLTRMCQTGLFQIAAHPDLIKMYTIDDFNAWLDTKRAEECVRTFLAALKRSNMAMEISSAGLRKNCQEIYPGPRIMKLASETNVLISFGADAHCINTPAYAFDSLARYAHSFGYQHHVIFIDKKAHAMPFSAPAPFNV